MTTLFVTGMAHNPVTFDMASVQEIKDHKLTPELKETPQSTDVYADKWQSYIETVTGENFYIERSPFDINVISHALGMLCRFNGHCSEFYSVASHSILVADIMINLGTGNPLEGLLHDATEAYLADIPSPWKVMLPQYKEIESRLDARLRKQFNLPEKITDAAKKADYMALFIEADHLIITKGENWPQPPNIREEALDYEQKFGLPWVFGHQPKEVSRLFLGVYHELLRNSNKP